MLDDLEKIEAIDKERMRDFLLEFPLHCKRARRLAEEYPIPKELSKKKEKIIICGLGGSAIGGEILKTLLYHEEDVAVFINRNYSLPELAGRNTLIFAVSYSGNTEETLAAYKEARKRGCPIFCISSGGELRRRSEEDGVPCLVIPSGMPPRCALGYLFIPMLRVLERANWLRPHDYEKLFQVLTDLRDRLSPSVPTRENLAKEAAIDLYGKIPLIWGVEGRTDAVAHRLKTQFNENSKILAFWDVFPELNHNEIVGWGGEGKIDLKNFYPIFIREEGEEEKIRKRIEVTQSLLEKVGIKGKEIWTEGRDLLPKILSSIYTGDWISFYLALIQGIDPTPVEPIDLLKRKLSQDP
ncbi:bifunctional phosphoglucose/phosphomannose isomerase [Candidatus Aerophobetes bacterium]|uniref:Bifunctional phosphoglucose/phosphomannose isomerase n=1 Tax=Aerophobetes bacterium TaxID=2030807 RepID=A0A523TCS9_UNCAE|nr:MAG: bifunctional phosphoglucose/phosphomannose isomerase [Candidatus Aerophobetes bacterium]